MDNHIISIDYVYVYFNELMKEASRVVNEVSKDLGPKLLKNKFPIGFRQNGDHGSKKVIHVDYDLIMPANHIPGMKPDDEGSKIRYLKPIEMRIYLPAIVKMFVRLGYDIDRNTLMRTIEILCVKQFYHIFYHNKDNFGDYSTRKGNTLIMGGNDIELLCFNKTYEYYMEKKDFVNVGIMSILRTIYLKDLSLIDRDLAIANIDQFINDIERYKEKERG